jgi:molecular chaperone GrpE (heat shock protein)
MADKYAFDDPFLPVPAKALEADPVQTLRDLYFRVGKLEYRLEEQEAGAIADWKDALLRLIGIYDALTGLVERWGISTSAREATEVPELVSMGKQILAVLQSHQVHAIDAIGEPLDPGTSDEVGSQERADVPSGIVLREVQIGYRWPHGILRKAKVIVSRTAATDLADDATVIS